MELFWQFPLSRPHCGVPLANGVQGVLIWGDQTLCLTVARAGFWDHRGGNPFATEATFSRVRELLEANDETGITELFSVPNKGANLPKRPHQIGGGRLEIAFSRGLEPKIARLNERGEVEIELANSEGETANLRVFQAMESETAWLEGAILRDAKIELKPSWDWIGEQLKTLGVAPPERWKNENGGGFVQTLPEDLPLRLSWKRDGQKIEISTQLGENSTSNSVVSSDFWGKYRADVPSVELPDALLQQFWDLGIHKQAGLTTPGGVAATLQGAWMEEYQLPPWSNDYHFNINAQLIYWPALATNRLEHFAPLWAMIKEWLPKMRENGEKFFGQKGALMLPHAVDDRCQVVGTFWTGTIDHACTAWIAEMAWLHYRYGLDETVLREIAWPLLNGAFEGYWAMREEQNGQFSLPISVSPEYRGSEMNAWGRDASFQLAAWHKIAQILPDAAQVLGEKTDSRWQEVEEKLPPYTLVNGRIGLWDGLELEESHRHHSHLAGIWPFESFDPLAAEHFETVAKTIRYWTKMGAGLWTGWCLPWASILCSRLELADAAVAWLHWLDNFCNAGFGTRHNADFAGVAAWDDGSFADLSRQSNAEIMQMDAAMGALTAITELLVQNRRGTIHILPALPRRWRELKFDGIRCEGAFLVGATVENGRTVEVCVRSEKGGNLKLATGLRGQPKLIERTMKAGESLILREE